MPRRREVEKREILPDPQYHDRLVARCINSLMFDGKKSVAESIMYGTLDILAARTKGGEDSSLDVFKKAVDNARPSVEVKSRRVGGSTYQVPMEVRPERRQTLGLRWITKYSRERNEKTMKERLAGEILDALNGTGGACKKRDDTHKMAEANKAFAHYRF